MKRQRKAKAERNTLAKQVRAASTVYRKLEVARGCDLIFDPLTSGAPVGMQISNLHSAIKSVRELGKSIPQSLKVSGEQENQLGKLFFKLGMMTAAAIADDNFPLFYRLGALLQHHKQPESHPRYVTILAFCEQNNCGTPSQPCDPFALRSFLKKAGYTYSTEHDNQVPRVLRADCKKLGVVLISRARRKRTN